MVDALSKKAILDQKNNIMGALRSGNNPIRSRMYFDETGKYQYLTYNGQECGGYVSIVPLFNIDGSIQYRQMTFDELHNAVVALLENKDAEITIGGTKLDKTNSDTIRQIVAQYFYICSRMESDLDLIIMERFWNTKCRRNETGEITKYEEATKEELEKLNEQLHVKLDLKQLKSFPVSRKSFYNKLYVNYFGDYQQSTRDAAQFSNVISKIEAVYKQLEIAPTTEAVDPLDDSAIKYEYIKAASSVMSHSKATVDGQEIPVGITCNIPFCMQTYAFEAVKDLRDSNGILKADKPDEKEPTKKYIRLTELLKTLYLNRIINSKGRVVTIGLPLNFIEELDENSELLYKQIAQEVLTDLATNAGTYGIKDKLIVADGFRDQPQSTLTQNGDVRLVFAAEKQYPITELAGKYGNFKNNISNYNEIQVYQSGDIVLVNNSSKEGEPKYCVNGQVKNRQTGQFYTEKDIERFGEPICTYEVKEVSLDALGDHLGAVGRYCSNKGGDDSADGIITGLPGVIDGLYGLGNPHAIADYQKKYTELQEIVKSKAFVEPEKAKIEMLPSFTAEAPSQPQPEAEHKPQAEPQAFDAKAIAKQIFEKNQKRTPKTINGITEPADEPGDFFDFEKFAKMPCTAQSDMKDAVVANLEEILDLQGKKMNDQGIEITIDPQEKIYLIKSGNPEDVREITIGKQRDQLGSLLEAILDTLGLEKDILDGIDSEGIKSIFEELKEQVEAKDEELGKSAFEMYKANAGGNFQNNGKNNVIFETTIKFLGLLDKPEERQNLESEKDKNITDQKLLDQIADYLKGLKEIVLSVKNLFDQIEEVFAYYRVNGADNLETPYMLDFYEQFYNQIPSKELIDPEHLKPFDKDGLEPFKLNNGAGILREFRKQTDTEKIEKKDDIAGLNPLTYKVVKRDGKKFIILNPDFLRSLSTSIEGKKPFAKRTPEALIKEIYEYIGKCNPDDVAKEATLVMPSLTDYEKGGHYVAYLYSGGEEVKALDSLEDKRQEFALESDRHFGENGAGFCGLHAVEAVMALTTGVQLIVKNRKDVKYFEIDADGKTKTSEERKLLVQPQLEKKEEKEKPTKSISGDEETPNTHFVPQDYRGKLLSEDFKFLYISNTGLKIKPGLNHKDSNFVIVNAGNGDIEDENLCLKLGGSGLNKGCGDLYSGEKGLIDKKIKEVSKEVIDKGSFKISEYAKGEDGTGRYVGCIFVQLEEQKITHLYAIGPRYKDFRDKDKKVNKKHFFEDLKFTNDAIFKAITSNFEKLQGKTIFFSGVSNNIFAGDLQGIKIKDIEDANIVDYFNAFCFMQFIQKHKDELKKNNIHIYLNKSISVAVQALCNNEQTREQVLALLNQNAKFEEGQKFLCNDDKTFALVVEKKDEGDDDGDSDSGYNSDSEVDTEFTDNEDETPKNEALKPQTPISEKSQQPQTTEPKPQTTEPKPQTTEQPRSPKFEPVKKSSPERSEGEKSVPPLSKIIQSKINEIKAKTNDPAQQLETRTPQPETRNALQATQQIKESPQIKLLEHAKSLALEYEKGNVIIDNNNIAEFKDGKMSSPKYSPKEAEQRLLAFKELCTQHPDDYMSITMDTKIEGVSETYRKKLLGDLFANEFSESAKKTYTEDKKIHNFEITIDPLTIEVEGVGKYILKDMQLGQVDNVVQAISEQNKTKLEELGVGIQSLTSQSGKKMDDDRFQAMLRKQKANRKSSLVNESDLRARILS